MEFRHVRDGGYCVNSEKIDVVQEYTRRLIITVFILIIWLTVITFFSIVAIILCYYS